MKLVCYTKVNDEGCFDPMLRLQDGDHIVSVAPVPDRLRKHVELSAIASAVTAALLQVGTVVYRNNGNEFTLAFEEIVTERGGVQELLNDNMRALIGLT